MNYEDMFLFVKKILEDHDALYSKRFPFRSRYEHIKRVYMWCLRIIGDIACDKEMLLCAAIFHDVGYAYGKDNHAHKSAELFLQYAVAHDMDYEFMMRTSEIISLHSDKKLLKEESSPIELVLLLEADLLDEEGAIGIVWDLMHAGTLDPKGYTEGLTAILEHSSHILQQDYMVTPLAKKYWNEKKELVLNFITNLKYDLGQEGEVYEF